MWEPIRQPAELDAWFAASEDRPVLLFKHSLTCGVSGHALGELERFCRQRPGATVGVVEIQPHRPVSEAIAARCGVAHQSPQALLLRGGRAVWQASHFAIDQAALTRAFDQHASGPAPERQPPAGGQVPPRRA